MVPQEPQEPQEAPRSIPQEATLLSKRDSATGPSRARLRTARRSTDSHRAETRAGIWENTKGARLALTPGVHGAVLCVT